MFSRKWPWYLLFGFFSVALATSLTISCTQITPEQQQALTTQMAAADTQASSYEQQMITQINALRATTQPTSTPEAIAQEKKTEQPLVNSLSILKKAHTAMTQMAPSISNTLAGGNPGEIITASAPLFGPYGPYVLLAGWLVTAVYGGIQNIKKNQVTTAGQTAVDAVQGAIANGQLVVANSNASAAIDAALTVDHPISNRLVDVIAAAPVTTPSAPKV